MPQALLQAHAHQQLLGAASPLAQAHALVGQRQSHVVQERGATEQIEALKYKTDAAVSERGQLPWRQVGHGMTVEGQRPAAQAIQTAHQV